MHPQHENPKSFPILYINSLRPSVTGPVFMPTGPGVGGGGGRGLLQIDMARISTD
jgi:hypothetical protein